MVRACAVHHHPGRGLAWESRSETRQLRFEAAALCTYTSNVDRCVSEAFSATFWARMGETVEEQLATCAADPNIIILNAAYQTPSKQIMPSCPVHNRHAAAT